LIKSSPRSLFNNLHITFFIFEYVCDLKKNDTLKSFQKKITFDYSIVISESDNPFWIIGHPSQIIHFGLSVL